MRTIQMKFLAGWTIAVLAAGAASAHASSASGASSRGSEVLARRIATSGWGGFADAEPSDQSTLKFMKGMAIQPQDNDMKPVLAEDGKENAEQMQKEVEKLARRTKALGSKGSDLAGELEGVEKELANDIKSQSAGSRLTVEIRNEREALCAGQGFHSHEHAECEAFMRKNCGSSGIAKSLLQKISAEHHHHHHRHNHSLLGAGNRSHNQSHAVASNHTRVLRATDGTVGPPEGLADPKREQTERSNGTVPTSMSKFCTQFFASHETAAQDEADDAEGAPAPATAESDSLGAAPAPAAAGMAGPAPGPMPKAWMKVSKSLRPLPEQGYVKGNWGYANEDLVMHQDMQSFVGDWNMEFGPRSGQRSFIEICKDFPDNEWCRLHQYVPTKSPDWMNSKFGPGGAGGGDQEGGAGSGYSGSGAGAGVSAGDGAGAGAGAGHGVGGGGFLPPWGGARRMQDYTNWAVVGIAVAICVVGM